MSAYQPPFTVPPIEEQRILWRPQVELLLSEAECLVFPWIALASSGQIDPQVEPKHALREWFVSQTGGGQSVWKAILKSESDLLTVRFMPSQGALESFRESVLLLHEFHTQSAVPTELLKLAASRLDQSMHVSGQLHRCKFYPAALVQSRIAIEDGAWPSFITQFDFVDSWWAETNPWLEFSGKRPSWGTLLGKALRWLEDGARRKHARRLCAPVEPLVVGSIKYEVIFNSFDLWRASRDLRNCLSSSWYASRIRQGDIIIVVGREVESDRAKLVAQLEPTEEGQIVVAEARGFANTNLPDSDLADVVQVAELIWSKMQQQNQEGGNWIDLVS